MSASTRLDRIMPKLSFDERLRGIVAAYHADRAPDPALLATMPAATNERWNGVVPLLNGMHTHLGWYIAYLEARVGQVELRFALHEQLRLSRLLVAERARDALAGAEDALALDVVGDLAGRWLDLRLAEAAAEECAEEVGVEVLLHPERMATLVGCRARLLAVRAGLEGYEIELPEPRPRDVERLVALLGERRELA
jgi:hypothetical protein